ncbi:MAG: Diadenylate cyclase [Chlamydiales bacterium]|nr:Diadenylate cyclase [Chlamydiales bacterium]MCH9635754.1 Diadenylate cyclase [Chlamydiales bacterium]MCH9703212.1 diadenylate cyclase CdaA [Chlamydiota bacterium]
MAAMHFFVPLIEITIIWVMLNYMLKFFWGTRAMDVVFGFLAFLFTFFLAALFALPVLQKIMLHMVNILFLTIFIIFQPEIRLALSRVRIKGRKFREVHEFDEFLENLTTSIYRFSEKEVGALVVLENQDSYQEYASSSLKMNAEFSSELLESIFMTTTPLHDGAVVIRGTTIVAAGTILPLAHETAQLSKSMGTRHRAALGCSQKTDAVIICVSEETGKVSIAREGILTRGIKIDRFRGILRSIFTPPELKKSLKLWKWSS